MLGRMREKTREWVRRYTHRVEIATKPTTRATSLRMLWLARHPWRWDVLRTGPGCSDEEHEYRDYHDQGEDLGR